MVKDSMLSQEGFASAAGLSRSFVQQKSSDGVHAIDRGSLRKIALFLRRGPSELAAQLMVRGQAKRLGGSLVSLRLPRDLVESLKLLAGKDGIEHYLRTHVADHGRSEAGIGVNRQRGPSHKDRASTGDIHARDTV